MSHSMLRARPADSTLDADTSDWLEEDRRLHRAGLPALAWGHRSEDWGFALLRCPELVRDGTTYLSPATAFGDIGAATGVMGALLATQAWARGYAAGPGALIWAGSDGGLRAAALLRHGEA